jgi:fibronectin type 3 domain-containing protein
VKYANSYIFYWDDTVVVAATAHKIDVGSLTSYTHSGLIPQKEYRYRVQAVKGNDSSALSPEYTYAAKGLPAPKGMRLIPGYKKITISCDSTYKMPIDKQGTPVTFNLYWADTLNGQKLSWHWAKSVIVISGVTLPYTMSGLEINHVYCFALVVVDGEFQGDLTSILNTKTLNLSPPDSFRVTSTGFKQLTLLWKSVDSADSYNVYWSTTESVTKSSEKISTASTSFAHTGLTMGTRYYYCVASVDGNYESQLSAVRLGMVNALTSPTVTLKAGLTSVELSWNSVANAVSYNVYRSQTNEISTSSEKFSCTGTDTVQVNLAPQTQYYYAVSSVNGADESGLSKISSIVTNKLLPPDSINISGDYRSIHITWNNSRDVGTCNVYYSENQDVNTMSNRIPVTGDSVYLTGLLPRKTYYIRISSVKDTYESALSLETPVTTGCLNSPYPLSLIHISEPTRRS